MPETKPHLFEEASAVILQGLFRGYIKKHKGHSPHGSPRYEIEMWDTRSAIYWTRIYEETQIVRYTEKIIKYDEIIAGDEIECIRWDHGITHTVKGTAHRQGPSGGWFNEHGTFLIAKTKEPRRILLLKRTKPAVVKKTAADYKLDTVVTHTNIDDTTSTYIKTGTDRWHNVTVSRLVRTLSNEFMDDYALSPGDLVKMKIEEPVE